MSVTISVRVPARRAILLVMLNALVRINQIILKTASVPPLYQAGIRYQPEGRDRYGNRTEDWLTIPELYRRKKGDCEDLVAARVAQLRARGINAQPWIYKAGGRMWHVVVKLPNGKIEDPSKRLGMRGPA